MVLEEDLLSNTCQLFKPNGLALYGNKVNSSL